MILLEEVSLDSWMDGYDRLGPLVLRLLTNDFPQGGAWHHLLWGSVTGV